MRFFLTFVCREWNLFFVVLLCFCFLAVTTSKAKAEPRGRELTRARLVGAWDYQSPTGGRVVVFAGDGSEPGGSYYAVYILSGDTFYAGTWLLPPDNVVEITETAHTISTGKPQADVPTERRLVL